MSRRLYDMNRLRIADHERPSEAFAEGYHISQDVRHALDEAEPFRPSEIGRQVVQEAGWQYVEPSRAQKWQWPLHDVDQELRYRMSVENGHRLHRVWARRYE